MGLFDSLTKLFSSNRLDIEKRFTTIGKATTGTMSRVLKVRDKETGQFYALKLLDRGATEDFEARFKNVKKPSEGQIAVALKPHPLLVQTFEFGLTTTNEQYVLMEYIEGTGLHDLILKKSPRLEGNRVVLMRQMAEALKAVHASGYLHRDVCPHNFLLCEDNTLKLIDFGLSVPATPDFMGPGNRTGKADYMAPELIRRQGTDHRVDVFALGVSAYELCAGKLPWTSGGGEAAIARANQTVKPLKELRPTIDTRFAKVIEGCLTPNPEDRIKTMDEVIKRLRRITSDDEVS